MDDIELRLALLEFSKGILQRQNEWFTKTDLINYTDDLYQYVINNSKKAEIEFNTEDMQLLQKAVNDPISFIQNIKIQHPIKDNIRFILREYQENIIQNIQQNRFNFIISSRQMGITTTCLSYALWCACMKNEKTIMVVCPNFSYISDLLSRLLFSYNRLPKILQPGIVSNNKDSIVFHNHSRILFKVASENAVRGMDIDCLIIDTVSDISNKIATRFLDSIMPIMVTSRKIIAIGNKNPKSRLYNELLQNPEINKILIPWTADPEKTETWKQYMIALRGSDIFNKEYDLSDIKI